MVTKTSRLPIRYLLALLWAHPILHVSRIRIKYKELMKTNIKHCPVISQFDLDLGPGKTENAVECNSTSEQ